MAFRQNRSRHFWIFSSYSVLFHLAGFLALLIFMGGTTPGPSTPTIMVRLVDSKPNIPDIFPSPSPTKASQPSGTTSTKKQQSLQSQSFPDLFHFIRPTDAPSPPNISAGNQVLSHPLVQVAINALIPVGFDQAISASQRTPTLEPSSTRVLVDHKAGNSLISTTPAKILYNPVPSYPKIARELGLEGKTLLRVEILQDGRPGTVKVRKSCGHPVLDEAAAKAIKKWKFAPAQDGLFAVRSVVDLPIRFSLKSLG